MTLCCYEELGHLVGQAWRCTSPCRLSPQGQIALRISEYCGQLLSTFCARDHSTPPTTPTLANRLSNPHPISARPHTLAPTHQSPWRTSRSSLSMAAHKHMHRGTWLTSASSVPAEFFKEGTLFLNRCTSTATAIHLVCDALTYPQSPTRRSSSGSRKQ